MGHPKNARFICTNTSCDWWAFNRKSILRHMRRPGHMVIEVAANHGQQSFMKPSGSSPINSLTTTRSTRRWNLAKPNNISVRTDHITSDNIEKLHFGPEPTLFRWWVNFIFRLTGLGMIRLTAQQLDSEINSLTSERHRTISNEDLIQYAHDFGFIAPAGPSGDYVFPLVHLLSYVSPLDRSITKAVLEKLSIPGERDYLLQQPLTDLLEDGFEEFSERTIQVIKAREGIPPYEKMTLAQIGAIQGCTRERIRQIEAKFWEQLRSLQTTEYRSSFITAFIVGFMRRRCTLVIDKQDAIAPLLSLLARILGIPVLAAPYGEFLILGGTDLNEQNLNQLGAVPTGIDMSKVVAELESGTLPYLQQSDLQQVAKSITDRNVSHLTKTERVFLTLKSIGKPSHYSEVTAAYNSLYVNEEMHPHNIHAILSRCAEPDKERFGIVWIGVKGTYALKEWGYRRPDKTIFDAVTDIVTSRYEESGGKPVSLIAITAELGKQRQVVKNASLIFATSMNPRLKQIAKDMFVPMSSDGLAEEELSDGQLARTLREFLAELQD